MEIALGREKFGPFVCVFDCEVASDGTAFVDDEPVIVLP